VSEEFEKFSAYLEGADKMIEQASKDEIADAARILALELSATVRNLEIYPQIKAYGIAHE